MSCSLVDNSVINELNTDTILVYDSIITDADFQCTAITYTPIDNCAEYDLDSIVGMDAPCVECDDGYYLLEETCVLDGAYKSDQADPDPNNCLYFEVIDDDAS
ncbi:MAG: hypothetical protein DHS20C13_29050 [Thermodesulfobacteriota bacterium]|nr:MAG: hypothetical protein DHS20C13_29050 [Thermodesulfobacteriota bacterium]